MGTVNAIEFDYSNSDKNIIWLPAPKHIFGYSFTSEYGLPGNVIIARGPTGSGKSSWANKMYYTHRNAIIMDIDYYKRENPLGNYVDDFERNVVNTIAHTNYPQNHSIIIVVPYEKIEDYFTFLLDLIKPAVEIANAVTVYKDFKLRVFAVEFTGYRGDPSSQKENGDFESLDFWNDDGSLKSN